MDNKTGTILEIQRMSTEDGPGLRTTVFLKGCPLKCSWCHNPESISPKKELIWTELDCIGCSTCIENCSQKALSKNENGIRIDRSLCITCGECAEECPTLALTLTGEEWNADDLALEVAKDKAYFGESGGVTISGGEVTMQSDFSLELLKILKRLNINTAIDTCGLCSQNKLSELLLHTDTILFDLKIMDPDLHRKFTGKSNERILENLKFVSDFVAANRQKKTLWIRTPIIPGATMDERNIKAAGKFISENLKGTVDRWELCTFNNLGKDKYERLGIKWVFENTAPVKREEIEKLHETAKNSVNNPEIVYWSGIVTEEKKGEEYEL